MERKKKYVLHLKILTAPDRSNAPNTSLHTLAKHYSIQSDAVNNDGSKKIFAFNDQPVALEFRTETFKIGENSMVTSM